LNACLKYKRFLDNLTPPEHKAAVSERKKSSKMRKLQDLKRYKPDVEMDIDDISSEEDPEEMYFKEPNQLLNIFAEIEERNLFLIQNVQETEEALEELKQKMNETEEKMREKTEQLDKNIQSLNEKIKIEEDKAQHYAKRNSANTTAPQTALLEKLRNKVQEVYEKCTGAGGEQSRPLDMLREIEAKLENLLLQIKALAEIDEERVKDAEKKREAERRKDVRMQSILVQEAQYEERLAKSTARAKAEVIRRTGKQVMKRTFVKKKKHKEQNVQKDDEAEDVKKFFTL